MKNLLYPETEADRMALRLLFGTDDLSTLYHPGESNQCGAQDPVHQFYCTRVKGHDGQHVAHYTFGNLCKTEPWD